MTQPLAIMPVFNEADILPWSIAHLIREGCAVHVIDNWSTDDSLAEASFAASETALGMGKLPAFSVERWPASGPDPVWQWTEMLERIEEIAAAYDGWVVFHDADEIRRSPRQGETIAQGLERIQAEGSNAVQFRVFEFWPIDDSYAGDPEPHFEFYRDGVDSRLPHIKAWLSRGQRVDLHTHGAHQAMFPDRRVSPEPWILKHYPIRTSEQGKRKIESRRARYTPVELAKNWHVQYQGVDTESIIRDPQELRRFS